MWINYQFMVLCPLDLKFFAQIFPKMACFLLICWCSQTFYPNWAMFYIYFTYIRHIHDILQLWMKHCTIWQTWHLKPYHLNLQTRQNTSPCQQMSKVFLSEVYLSIYAIFLYFSIRYDTNQFSKPLHVVATLVTKEL